jgi:hypothetical protein
MTTIMNRRAVMAGTVALASTALPAVTTPAVEPAGLSELPEGCKVLQVIGNSYAPAVRRDDFVIYREGDAKPGDRVVITLRDKGHVLAELINCNCHTITARPLQSGARLQAIPVKSVKAMARVVAFYSP